jgi:hypothetical protein
MKNLHVLEINESLGYLAVESSSLRELENFNDEALEILRHRGEWGLANEWSQFSDRLRTLIGDTPDDAYKIDQFSENFFSPVGKIKEYRHLDIVDPDTNHDFMVVHKIGEREIMDFYLTEIEFNRTYNPEDNTTIGEKKQVFAMSLNSVNPHLPFLGETRFTYSHNEGNIMSIMVAGDDVQTPRFFLTLAEGKNGLEKEDWLFDPGYKTDLGNTDLLPGREIFTETQIKDRYARLLRMIGRDTGSTENKPGETVFLDRTGKEKRFLVEWNIASDQGSDEQEVNFLVITETHILSGEKQIIRCPIWLNHERVKDAVYGSGLEWRNIDRIVGASLLYSYPPPQS